MLTQARLSRLRRGYTQRNRRRLVRKQSDKLGGVHSPGAESAVNGTSGTVQASWGVNARSDPAIRDGNIFSAIKDGDNFLILGRSSDYKWIATARNGEIGWMKYGDENVNDKDRIIRLPEGVNITELPEYKDDATLDIDPNSPLAERD